MHDAFEPVPILEKLPLQIDCLAAWGELRGQAGSARERQGPFTRRGKWTGVWLCGRRSNAVREGPRMREGRALLTARVVKLFAFDGLFVCCIEQVNSYVFSPLMITHRLLLITVANLLLSTLNLAKWLIAL